MAEKHRKNTRVNLAGRRKSDLVRLEMMWNIVDWDTSLAKATLDIAGQGAYRNILDKLYICGGKLLNEKHVLFHASGCRDEGRWDTLCEQVMQFFVLTEDAKFITHHRVLEQINKVKEISKIRRQVGRLGNKVKQAKHLDGKTPARNCDTFANANPPTFAYAKPSPTTTTTTNIKSKERAISMNRKGPPQGCTKHPTSGITDKGDCYGCYAELAHKPKPPCSQHPHSGTTDKGMCYGCYRESFTPIPGRAN